MFARGLPRAASATLVGCVYLTRGSCQMPRTKTAKTEATDHHLGTTRILAKYTALNVESTINRFAGKNVGRCVGPMEFRDRDLKALDDESRFAMDIDIVAPTITVDLRRQPERVIAKHLRKLAAGLN